MCNPEKNTLVAVVGKHAYEELIFHRVYFTANFTMSLCFKQQEPCARQVSYHFLSGALLSTQFLILLSLSYLSLVKGTRPPAKRGLSFTNFDFYMLIIRHIFLENLINNCGNRMIHFSTLILVFPILFLFRISFKITFKSIVDSYS